MSVGQPISRVDAIEKVTGRAIYAVDVRVPGMAHATLVRSPFPRARVLSVSSQAAQAVSGVIAILTARDMKAAGRFDLYFGHQVKDQPVLADGEVRYQGEPVAAVVAENPKAAQEAARLVEVDYEPLEYVDTLDAALQEGAPLVHERVEPVARWIRPVPGTNIVHHFEFEKGDGVRGFAEADLVVEDTFEFPMLFHAFLEPLVAVAMPSQQGLTVWTSAQHPFQVRSGLAAQFGMPEEAVRVIVPHVGGAYGGKGFPKIEPLTCALAVMVGRPVRLALSMEESFQTIRSASCRCVMRTGVKRDGRLVARQVTVYFQAGAYADSAPAVTRKGGYAASGPYRVPHLRVDAYAVYTHTVPAGAFRGFGVPQVAFAHEVQMDRIARELGIDPLDLRLRNVLGRGEPYLEGELPMDADLAFGLRKVAETLRGRQGSGGSRRRVLVGEGFSCAFKAPVSPSDSEAEVRLDAEGRATLYVGTTELGQGARTVLLQIAAAELGLPLERWSLVASDTARVPYDQSTSGSRSTTLMGLAVQRAARQVKLQLAEAVERLSGRQPERFQDGAAWVEGKAYPYGVLVRTSGSDGREMVGRGEYRGDRTPTPQGGKVPFWELGMGAARVEVDPETGRTVVQELVTAADVGKAINPMLCQGQDEGGAAMGMGAALFEELAYQDGQLINAGLADYRVPTFEDVPAGFESILVENGDGPGPFGAKGAGESGVYVAAAAIANAVYAATGKLPRRLPLTPERVWELLQEGQNPGKREERSVQES